MISLTVDGCSVEVEDGTTILQAAKRAGIEIPTLCHDDRLTPYGACRMCVVEVKGNQKLLPACTSPVAKDMEVVTNTERLRKIRRTILEMQCVNHPLDCPVCDAAGECKLQDLVYALGLQGNRFEHPRRNDPPDSRSPLVERNLSRCIFCARCVRICLEVQGVGAIGLINRGFDTFVGPPFGEPLDCEFCGQCIATCPVGALTSKIFKFRARSWFLTRTESTCPHCGTGCRIGVEHMNGKVLRITAKTGEGVNDGNLCPKGRFGYEFVNSEDRNARPLIRKNGTFAESSWGDALDAVARGLKDVLEAGNPKAVGFLGSPRLTNEENYLVGKLARVGAGTNNVDTVARFGHVHALHGARKAFGSLPAFPTYEAIASAKTIVVVDSVVTETNPVMGNHILKAKRDNGAKVVLLSPRGSKLDRHSDLWLRHRPGGAGALLMAVAHAMVNDAGLEEGAGNFKGFETFKASLADFAPGAVAEAVGVDEGEIRDLAAKLAGSGPSFFLVSLPSFENVKGSLTWRALFNLSLLAGASGKGRLGVMTATEACNLQGALDAGAAPEFLPGLVPADDEEGRKILEEVWGKELPAEPGLDAQRMIEEAEAGTLQALVVFGENPVFNFPDAGRVETALAKLKFLAVVDPFMSETAKLAHVVLPACSFAEKSGSFTNTEGRIQAVNASVPTLLESRPDWEILCELLNRLGLEADYESPGDVALEMEKASPALVGIGDPTRTGGEGLLWHDGTKSAPAFLEGPFPEKPKAPAKGEFTLVTGALLNHSGTVTRHGPGLNEVVAKAQLRIHPEDAAGLGVEDGDKVLVKGKGSTVEAEAKLDDTLFRGSLFLPVHFTDAPVNRLTSAPGRDGEREPATVTLEKVPAKVGAGA